MTKMYSGTGNEFICEMLDEIFEDERRYMYVLSNEFRHLGANAILNYDILHNFAMEHDSNLIIYPSSVHELIVILEKDYRAGVMDAEAVKHINEETVCREDWLSNSVYIYDKDQSKLRIYQMGEPLSNNKEH